MFTLIHCLHANALLCTQTVAPENKYYLIILCASFKMPRDLLFCTFLLLLIRCSTADYLFSEDIGNNSDLDNKTNWVCDLGRTTGLIVSVKMSAIQEII